MLSDYEANLKIICLESAAFYALMDEVVERVVEKVGDTKEKWISDDEAMKLLHITSDTTLQKYRDEGKIRFSQPSRKLILYDRDSIMEFIEKNVRNPF